MKGKNVFGSGCALLLLFGSFGCQESVDFPDEPEIEFKSFERNDDGSADLTIEFTDGDGDIGLNEGDTTGKYAPGKKYFHNLFVHYYEKQDGEWVKRDLNPPYFYRVPVITPDGKNKALEGDIEVHLEKPYYDPNNSFDTIKYRVQLVDRALNESNKVFSPVMTKE